MLQIAETMTCQNVRRDEEVMTDLKRKWIKSPFDCSTCQAANMKETY